MLSKFIEFSGDLDSPMYIGYLYALVFFLGMMIAALAENQYFDRAVRTGIEVRIPINVVQTERQIDQ